MLDSTNLEGFTEKDRFVADRRCLLGPVHPHAADDCFKHDLDGNPSDYFLSDWLLLLTMTYFERS